MVNEYKNSPSYHRLFPMGEFILVIAKRWAGSQQSSICFLGENEREKNSRLSEQQTHSLVIPHRDVQPYLLSTTKASVSPG